MADGFHCSVVTPERAVLEVEDARSVTFPAHDGEVGIMKGRAPLLTRMGIGKLRVESPSGAEELFVDGGFAQMVDDKLTILTEQALPLDAVDTDSAKASFGEAQAIQVTDERSFRKRQAALERGRVQRRLASS